MSRPDPWVLKHENLCCLPVCHYRLEFAEQVRLQFQKDPPDVLALELPSNLTDPYLRAVTRLPEISVLLFENPSRRTAYIPVEPVDPFVEATRLAQENSIPVHLVDINLEEAYPPFTDPIPDPYAINIIGPEPYYSAFRWLYQEKLENHPLDLRREQAMAYHLKDLMKRFDKVLFVSGMLHAKGVLHRLSQPQAIPLESTSTFPIQIFNLHPTCLDEVLSTFPFLSALYEVRRQGLPEEPEPDRFSVRRHFRIQSQPFTLLQKDGPVFDETRAFRDALDRVARRTGFGGDITNPPGPIDRNRTHLLLFEETRRHYQQRTGEELRIWQKKNFWKFVRNYALLDGLLLPDFYHLLSGARACVDDNFCYEFLQQGSFYPWQTENSNQPTLRISGEDVWLGTRKLHVRRWSPRNKGRLHRIVRNPRKKERYPGEWLESFDGSTLCSFPPEDIVIENYGKRLREQWSRILRDEQDQTEPFTSSLHDGLDIRETLRKWSEKRIYVRKRREVGGSAGAVVVIFDDDGRDDKYPYKMTWLGEHEQESDMAFYATPPEDNIVGPGICRCEYGGFLMTYPPRRLLDVWQDPDYWFLKQKSEVLLTAALDYSLERCVVYVAAQPPKSYMRTIAERLQRQIAYVPLASLSPSRLMKIRVFHILNGYDKRDVAKDFIV